MKKTHGKTKTKEFKIWLSMINRCTNKNDKSYLEYGAVGVYVCERWRYSFENFLNDMGLAPSQEYSIDRIKNNIGYEPTNCRWATPKEQARNRKSNILIEIDGEIKCLLDWCNVYGANYGTVQSRRKRGMNIKEALQMPPKSNWTRHPNKKFIEFDGITMDINGWSKKTGISYFAIMDRLRNKWSIKEALTTPSSKHNSVRRYKNIQITR